MKTDDAQGLPYWQRRSAGLPRVITAIVFAVVRISPKSDLISTRQLPCAFTASASQLFCYMRLAATRNAYGMRPRQGQGWDKPDYTIAFRLFAKVTTVVRLQVRLAA